MDGQKELIEKLAKIEANQGHQTELLEEVRNESKEIYSRLSSVESTADRALIKAQKNETDLSRYEKEQINARRWLIGAVIGLLALILPIFDKLLL